jgi:NAD(P)-dependent dehydrogenase (short-subunit alcohol dehydrogenase family)
MNQRVVVVTGAAGGVGHATAELFHREGWYVVGIDRKPHPADMDVDRFEVVDLAQNSNVEETFAAIDADLGRIDALVNNAAIQIAKPMVETTAAEWDLIMDTNVRMAFRTMLAAHPRLQERGGSVVNVSSIHAVATSRSIAVYAASKGALVALTRAAALEMAADRIRVNAVLPGAVDTPMLRAGMLARADRTVEESMAILSSKTPLGRIGRAEEIAQAILFLADPDRSSFITGQLLLVDGGAAARLSTE